MDPRRHVGEALVRVLQRPGAWPTPDLSRLRNQVLDECGGDLRTLVVFLMQLADFGVPQAIFDGAARGDVSWHSARNQLALTLASERFLLPEMARWGVDCWGAALGAPGAVLPSVPVPSTPLLSPVRAGSTEPSHAAPRRPALANHKTVGAAARVAGRPTPALGPVAPVAGRGGHTRSPAIVPAWVKPTKVPPVARWISGSHLAPPTPTPPGHLTSTERRALAVIATLSLAAMAVISLTSGKQDAPGPSSGTPDAAASAPSAADVLPASDHTVGTRTDSSTQVAAAARATRDDARALSAPSTALQGDFHLAVRRSSVHGDERCDSIATRIRWNQVSVEQIRLSDAGRRFEMVTRPGVGGTVGPTGEFISEVVSGERDGTVSVFHMRGWLTPTGFRAVGETSTSTLLRWRKRLECRFVAELEGVRLIAGSPAPVP